MSLQTKALVSVRWLSEALRTRASTVRVLDASWFLPKLHRSARSEFRSRHIPSASFLDLDKCSDRSSPMDHMLPTASDFSEFAGRLGVARDSHVVVYDSSEQGAFSAPRAWWMFRVFGHSAVSVLNGGLRAWTSDGQPLEEGKARKHEPAEYNARLNRAWVKTFEDVLRNVYTREFQLVDARPAGRFRGTDPEPRDNTEPGHIPGSINIPFTSFLAPSGVFLSPDELRTVFQKAGVDLDRPLCVTCGSAVTACLAALAAHQCGHQDMSVYDGGWMEWYTRAPPELVISDGRGKHL
ncbi:3-mercaptopyruvate sulfurtransferase-like [Hoplias malabaricus]|uniref:3-mercaptopyruvate sulfurtransferase-like n=1 Tax=Hoplias malabaricus TaxID=27720 RepID=UPI0034619F8A